MNALMQQAMVEVGGPANMGRRLGLTTSAVKRWLDRGEAPWQYQGDFKRILGTPGLIERTGDPVRDRDQFYTKRAVARQCVKTFRRVAKDIGVDLRRKHWIEPSAGCGWFLLEFPRTRRTGIDLEPKGEAKDEIVEHDFLLWHPDPFPHGCVVLGNPPFGLRGHLALQFVNRAAEFADMVGFIVPQLFCSDGKGVPGKRVDPRLKLAYSEPLPENSFETPDGRDLDVSTTFQVWTAVNKDQVSLPEKKTCLSYITVYSLSDGGTPSSTRNKHMLDACDVYLPSTCYTGMEAKSSFAELPHRRGYGVVIHKRKAAVKSLLVNHDWGSTAFRSTNGAVNLRRSIIEEAVINGGFCDEGRMRSNRLAATKFLKTARSENAETNKYIEGSRSHIPLEPVRREAGCQARSSSEPVSNVRSVGFVSASFNTFFQQL